MDYKDYLAKELERILAEEAQKQALKQIDDDLDAICREQNSFTDKIKGCLAKDEDLPEDDVNRINELGKQFNQKLAEAKKLISGE